MYTRNVWMETVSRIWTCSRGLGMGSALVALVALVGCGQPAERTGLTALDISGPVDLSPAFDPDTTTYTADVSILVQSLAVTPIPVLSEATVMVNGMELSPGETSPAIPLALGENTIEIEIETPKGETQVYTIVVNRAATIEQQLYAKSSLPGTEDYFGWSLATDGDLLAVGAPFEDSAATGIGGEQQDDSARNSGAVYLFRRSGKSWQQEAYLKASNTGEGDGFGWNLALMGDTLAVAAPFEDSAATGIDTGLEGDQQDDSVTDSGAVYLFRRDRDGWSQTAYVKASNPGTQDYFGSDIELSADFLVVGAPGEASSATGQGGDQTDDSVPFSGAVYLFRRAGDIGWEQEAYLKASNPGENDYFGSSLGLSADTLAVSAFGEDSAATGINGDQANDDATDSGAVYLFRRVGDAAWEQEAYVKASNAGAGDTFGSSLVLANDTLVVGAPEEDSSATGVGGVEDDDSVTGSGAAYVFQRRGRGWAQTAYVKSSNAGTSDFFGSALAIQGDVLAISATGEASAATGIDIGPGSTDDSAYASGAVYVFLRTDDRWSQQSYLKASNTNALDLFGFSLALSKQELIVGAVWEDSSAAGIDANQQDDSELDSGAIYIFQ